MGILVVGATGTVGSELVAQLAERGHKVRALVRDPAKLRDFGSAIEPVIADLTKPETLSAAFAGMERVFVLAPPVPDLEQLEANALAAAERARVKHIVYLSNFGAGVFEDDLWQAHGINEQRLRAMPVIWTILRPVRFMSHVPYAWASIHAAGKLIEPHGGRKVTMIDPRDIATVAMLALTTPGHESTVYELVGEALTGVEIARGLSVALGKSVAFVDANEEEAREELLRSGLPTSIAEKVLYYFRTLREGRWYETPTLRTLLGRTPRTYEGWLREKLPQP
jgi:uncharacterized protein YbjT (DUF2867 family)